jgi:hypothetical protein
VATCHPVPDKAGKSTAVPDTIVWDPTAKIRPFWTPLIDVAPRQNRIALTQCVTDTWKMWPRMIGDAGSPASLEGPLTPVKMLWSVTLHPLNSFVPAGQDAVTRE